nr:MurR/RpiR family transcriptional regulator [Clostridium sp. MCC353]
MTRTESKIAKYFIKNKSILAFQSLKVIAADLNISDISIVRFSRTLGYDGFADLKRQVQAELALLIDKNPEDVNTLTKFTSGMEMRQFFPLENTEQMKDLYCGMVQKTIERNEMETFSQAADLMVQGKSHYIVGSFSRIGAVETLYTLLLPILPNLFKLTEWGFEASSILANLKKDDCVILFSFGRLCRLEKEVLMAVNRERANLIVITDKKETNTITTADVTLYSKANAGLPFYSNVSNAVVSEILAAIISQKTWETSRERLANVDMLIASLSK